MTLQAISFVNAIMNAANREARELFPLTEALLFS